MTTTSPEAAPLPIVADLLAEQAALDAIVAPLDADQWEFATPSPRWTVADQIAHLTYFDRSAALAIGDPEGFREATALVISSLGEGNEALDEATLTEMRTLKPAELYRAWGYARAELLEASATLAKGVRVPWYGPSMGAVSFLTARLMEVWAHGQDIIDALNADDPGSASRPPTARLRHIAHLGAITRDWSYINRGKEPPAADLRIELADPTPGSTEIWSWGPEDASERVSGPAEDFCLVVTQRRHFTDTDLVVVGDGATDWMGKAQAFAGPATDGPSPVDA